MKNHPEVMVKTALKYYGDDISDFKVITSRITVSRDYENFPLQKEIKVKNQRKLTHLESLSSDSYIAGIVSGFIIFICLIVFFLYYFKKRTLNFSLPDFVKLYNDDNQTKN